MRYKSITLRLTLFFIATSSTVLIAVGVLVSLLIDAHFEDQDLGELKGKLELISHALSKVRTDDDLRRLPQRLQDALVGHPGLVVAVTNAGTILYPDSGGEVLAPLLNSARADAAGLLNWTSAGVSYRGLAQTMRAALSSGGPYRAAVAIDISHHREFTSALRKTLVSAVSLGIVLTGFLGWIVARRGLAPVRDIARLAKNISASRLGDRLGVDSVPEELIDLAGSFNDMLARLEESFTRLSEFSSDLAHELRTPVSNLMTQTHVALGKSRTAEEYREILHSNIEEYDRLARMISDMLFLAKADHGLIVPHRESVNVAFEVDELMEFYDALADAQGVSLIRSGQGTASGDRLMIRRAISNLLSNAIRHTPRGGVVKVDICANERQEIRISVENPGEAIGAEHLPRLFDRFYHVDPFRRRDSEGAGLGLAIVKSIVLALNGTIEVRSGQGLTRFIITFRTIVPPQLGDAVLRPVWSKQ